MSETAVPKTWSDARDIVLANSPWCLLLVAIERAFEGHFYQAILALLSCFAAIGIAIHWRAFEGLRKPEGRRRLAFALIIAGALLLATGIYFLASQPRLPEKSGKQPVNDISEDQASRIKESSELNQSDLRNALDRQSAIARELQTTKAQRDELKAEVGRLKKPAGTPNQLGPVDWNLEGQLVVVSGGGQSAVVNGIILMGTSTSSLRFKEAYLVSGLTGHNVLLKANVQHLGQYFSITKVDVPSDAPVQLDAIFEPAPSIKDFLDQWGKFRFIVVYEDGVRFEYDFDERHVRAKVQQMAPNAFGPRVTPRIEGK